MLTPNGQLLDCATTAFSKRYVCQNLTYPDMLSTTSPTCHLDVGHSLTNVASRYVAHNLNYVTYMFSTTLQMQNLDMLPTTSTICHLDMFSTTLPIQIRCPQTYL
jgi:hypothetical protein